MPNLLEVQIGSMTMKNPVTVASGTFGYGPEYAELVNLNRLGTITVKVLPHNRTSKSNTTPMKHAAACSMQSDYLTGPRVYRQLYTLS